MGSAYTQRVTDMVGVGTTDKTQRLTEILQKTGLALEEVFQHYKCGRHESDSTGKSYFLLSHCAHLLFSLRLTDEDSGGDLFRHARGPAAFLAELDCGPFPQADGNIGKHQADSLDDHLENEPKWFGFWMGLLEWLDPREAQNYREFAQRVLTYVGDRSFLEGKAVRKNKKVLDESMKTITTGRILLRTMSVLQNMIRVITAHFATLDAKTCAAGQVMALTCLLNRIRRTIVWEAPVIGPYVPRGAKSWKRPLSLARLHFANTEGTLTLVPKREGGEIICSYHWLARSAHKRRSWTIRTSTLKRTYEQELFATWSCETGEYLQDPGRFPEASATWIVQNAEAERLENLSRQAELVLNALRANPACRGLVAAVAPILRNAATRWKATELPWPYIGQLDALLDKLAFACREAKVLGGENPAAQVIQQIWPSEPSRKGEARREPKPPQPSETTTDGSDAEVTTEKHSLSGRTMRPKRNRAEKGPAEGPQPPLSEATRTKSLPPEPAVQEGHGSQAESHTHRSKRQAELLEPDQPQEQARAEDPAGQPPVEQSADWGADAPVSQDGSAPDNALLLQRLRELHRSLNDAAQHKPLSLTKLVSDLGWSRCRVQRAMTDLFGPKPFTAYKKRCKDRTIADFLDQLPANGTETLIAPACTTA